MGKKRFKRLCIVAVLTAIFLTMGCGSQSGSDSDNNTAQTVENVFTENGEDDETTIAGDTDDSSVALADGTASGEDSDDDISGAEDEEDDVSENVGFAGGESWSEDEDAYVYDGGEVQMTFNVTSIMYEYLDPGNPMGVMLFVDGKPQAYRVEGGDDNGDESTAYIHVFYSDTNEGTDYEFRFVPVTGSEGDKLEMYSIALWNPEYFAKNGAAPYFLTGRENSRDEDSFPEKDKTYLILNAEPSASESSVIAYIDTVETYSLEYVDLTSDEKEEAERNGLDVNESLCFPRLYLNGEEEAYIYNVTSEDTVTLRMEVYGATTVTYGLTFFVNHVPILFDGEPIEVTCRTGQKTVVEIAYDLSEFDGQMIIYGVLAPLNYLELREKQMASTSQNIRTLSTYFLTSLSSWEELVAAQ